MRVRHVIGVAGAFATLLAAVAVVLPGSTIDAGGAGGIATAFTDLRPRSLLFGGVSLVTLFLLLSSLVSTGERHVAGDASAAERFERAVDRRPESPVDATPRTAGEFDAVVDRAIAGDDAALERVRDRLVDLAAAVLAARRGDGPAERAARAIVAGTWTDDRTAAAFLAGRAGPSPSLASRLRLWLDPDAERERRIRRTVRRIERLDGESG